MPAETTALDTPKAIEGYLANREERLLALLSGADITPDQFIGMTVQALARDPRLLAPSIDKDSLLLAILTVAEMGLTPTGAGGAHLVPFWEGEGSSRRQKVEPITDWRGFIKMAMRSGQLATAWTALVYEGDEFSYELGDTPRLYHTPSLSRAVEAKVTHVYAVAQLMNGAKLFEVMTMAEIEAIKSQIRNIGSNSPWVTHPGEQYRKTAVRRLFKYLPVAVTPIMAAALQREDDLEGVGSAETPRPALSGRHQRLLAHATGADAEGDGGTDSAAAAEPVNDGLPEMPAEEAADAAIPEA
jgi:recombination protein RecT